MHKVPSENINSNIVIAMYFFLKALPMLLSGITIYLGYSLFVLGVTGKASISIHSETIEGQLINAAPGLFFAIGGLISLIISIWKGVKVEFSGANHNGPVHLKLPCG
ncbi:MAG: hypothetical protein KAU38_06275 [Desulfobacterales bacterium]|nr:hypothetical protein [Desulfobacterales bacterium]